MERRPAVIRRLIIVAAALLLGAASSASRAGETVVLIVSSASPVVHLETIEVRKLFLGLTVIRDELPLRALANQSDDRLHEVFLQNVIGMPEAAYERRLLMVALQQGARRPRVYTNTAELLNAVAVDPSAVSFARIEDVANDRRLRILRILWRD